MVQEILKYKSITNQIEKLISESPLKVNYIIEKSGIPSATFYRKLKQNDFSPDEILTIFSTIKPEEYEYEMIMEKIRLGDEQFANGEFDYEEDWESVEEIIARRIK